MQFYLYFISGQWGQCGAVATINGALRNKLSKRYNLACKSLFVTLLRCCFFSFLFCSCSVIFFMYGFYAYLRRRNLNQICNLIKDGCELMSMYAKVELNSYVPAATSLWHSFSISATWLRSIIAHTGPIYARRINADMEGNGQWVMQFDSSLMQYIVNAWPFGDEWISKVKDMP